MRNLFIFLFAFISSLFLLKGIDSFRKVLFGVLADLTSGSPSSFVGFFSLVFLLVPIYLLFNFILTAFIIFKGFKRKPSFVLVLAYLFAVIVAWNSRGQIFGSIGSFNLLLDSLTGVLCCLIGFWMIKFSQKNLN